MELTAAAESPPPISEKAPPFVASIMAYTLGVPFGF